MEQKGKLKFGFGFLPVFFLVLSLQAQDPAWDRAERMGKGVNLSNWLEAYWESEEDYAGRFLYTYDDLREIRDAGIRHIRFCITFERVTSESAPYTIDFSHRVFGKIDTVLTWAEELDLMVVIDNHHGWGDMNDLNYSESMPRVREMWRQVAAHYASTDPENVLFEVMNEPPILLSRGKTRDLMFQCLNVIRQSAPSHTVILSGALGSHGLELFNTIPVQDPNVIYTFHFYEPFYFTHQGASWSPVYFPIGTPYPSSVPGELASMRNIFVRTYAWQEDYNIPVYVGEFGAIAFADEESRCNWVEQVGQFLEEYGFPWSTWDWKLSQGSGFGYFSGNTVTADSIHICYARALNLYDDGPVVGVQDAVRAGIQVHPNPAEDLIWIDLHNAIGNGIGIFDITGRQLMAVSYVFGGQPIDISALLPGTYLLLLRDDQGRFYTARIQKL